jgi:hypothetical protein
MASSGVLPQAFADTGISQKTTEPIITNTAGEIYRQNSIYDLTNPFDTSTQASAATGEFANIISDDINKSTAAFNQTMTSAAKAFNEWGSQYNLIQLPETFREVVQDVTLFGKNFVNTFSAASETIAGVFKGISPAEEFKIRGQRAIIKSQIQDGIPLSGSLEHILSKPGGGKFIGGGAFFEETGAFTFVGSDDTMKGLNDKLSADKKELSDLRAMPSSQRKYLDPMGFRELELSNEIINIEGRINEIEKTEEGSKNILKQDMLLKETITDIVPNIEAQADLRKRQYEENQKLQEKILKDQIEQDRENEIRLKITQGARKHGISESLYARRTGLEEQV